MEYQAHRGVGTEFPENTLPAFKAAIAQGYGYIELDPCFTEDQKCVVLHDSTLNRTCRNADGSPIDGEVKISDITYSEALKYDAGIAKSNKFKGTKIPLLSEVFNLAKGENVVIKLDNRIQFFTKEQTDILFNLVKASKAKISFTSSKPEYIKFIAEKFENAEIHYDGPNDDGSIKAVKSYLKNNPLTVWLPVIPWGDLEVANDELCKRIKDSARLGLWILNTDEQLHNAIKWNADIIETPGQLKPIKKVSGYFDCHTHSEYSHDSVCRQEDMLKSATDKGLEGIAVTDHCDIEFCNDIDVRAVVKNSVRNAEEFGEKVFTGSEIGEGFWHLDAAEEILRKNRLDIVLGSVHAVRYGEYTMPYSQIDFSKFSDKMINEYLNAYFDDMITMINDCDFDVLSHITCPLRYICGKYHRNVQIGDFSGKIDRILKSIIEKSIALEVNTSCLGTDYDRLLPDISIIKRYKELGGSLITLGSDAHVAPRAGFGFDKTAKKLSALGFDNLYYYKNRIPIPYTTEVKA